MQKVLKLREEIRNKRQKILENMLKNALPGKQIKVDRCEEGYCLRIRRICKEGIEWAKEKLKIFERGFLGYLILSVEGVKFEGTSEIYSIAESSSNKKREAIMF